jgi:hypothetical protein
MPVSVAIEPDNAIHPRCASRLHSPGAVTLMALAFCSACASAKAEPFIGQFELKTLESAPGRFEFQSQNAWSWSQPARQIDGDELNGVLFDENAVIRARYALELEMGFTRRLKMRLGVEFERERFDEPETSEQANDFDDLSLTEVGAELIAVIALREGDGPGLGVVAEIEGPTDQEEPNNLIIGPIIEFQSGRWFAAAVPMAVRAFGGDAEDGDEIDNKWDFAYALQLMHTFSDAWTLALEGYGTVDRLGSTGRPSEAAQLFGDFDQHRLGPILYYTHDFGGSKRIARPTSLAASLSGAEEKQKEGTALTIGFGLLAGLNENTPEHTLKLSIEVEF